MNSLEWKTLYRLIVRAARRQPRGPRTPHYPDTLMVAMHFWAVQHDRPQCWACEKRR